MIVNKYDIDWIIISAKSHLGIDVADDIEILAELGHPIACASYFYYVRQGKINHINSKIETTIYIYTAVIGRI